MDRSLFRVALESRYCNQVNNKKNGCVRLAHIVVPLKSGNMYFSDNDIHSF